MPLCVLVLFSFCSRFILSCFDSFLFSSRFFWTFLSSVFFQKKKITPTWLRETISCMMKIITMAWVDNLRELLYVEMQLTMYPNLFRISTPVFESLYYSPGLPLHCRFLVDKTGTVADTLPACCCYHRRHSIFRKIQAKTWSWQSYLLWRRW